jgi:hypothetical protein
MEAHQLSEESATPVQLSLRVRHPTIAPDEISAAFGVSPEHCFRAGDPRTDHSRGRRSGQHTQTYWLAIVTAEWWADPIDPAFLSVIAARYPEHNVAVSAENLRKATQNSRLRTVETLLFYCLQRLNTRHAFLERIQSDGGDVSLLLLMARDSAADFTLPVAMTRMLVKMGISLEFKFDS